MTSGVEERALPTIHDSHAIVFRLKQLNRTVVVRSGSAIALSRLLAWEPCRGLPEIRNSLFGLAPSLIHMNKHASVLSFLTIDTV